MTIGTPDILLTGNDAVAAMSFSFTATTPAAGRQCFAGVRTIRAGGGIVPVTFTALGLTWAQVDTLLSGTTRLTVYESTGGTPSGTSVVVNVNDGGANHSSCSVHIVAHPTAGVTVQHATGTGASGADPTVTLAAITAGNGVGMFAVTTAASAGFTAEAGFDEAGDFGVGTGGAGRMTYIWNEADTDSTPLTTEAPAAAWMAIGFEIGPPDEPTGSGTFLGVATASCAGRQTHRASGSFAGVATASCAGVSNPSGRGTFSGVATASCACRIVPRFALAAGTGQPNRAELVLGTLTIPQRIS